MPRINIEVEPELHKKAKLSAVLQNKTLIQYINEAIREKVEGEKPKK
ncbi:toxin-antitoxin system HicB family antitoxin [Candidatus Woesearchaeota archaeon]|nr:toxin-antitoxin system HicB family antitoxin [Candidatus Woesearchaeota archaeon]MBI2130858.1 toxin-antitoxin system HicB family antitoxin [Candidatus Woesearchaeota archaeon]MBI2660982.1 toxin-antitoxin system HicB family antitoxin [Candidatus Woesearchaeota archaeon]